MIEVGVIDGSAAAFVDLPPGTFDGIDLLPPPSLPHVETIGKMAMGTAILYGAATIREHMSYESGGVAPQEIIDEVVATARKNGVPEHQLPLMRGAAEIQYFWDEFGNNG